MGPISKNQENERAAQAAPLQTELGYFNEIKEQLLADSGGRFAVVHGTELAGCWDTYRDAVQVGYARFGLEPFLVKQVLEVEPVISIFSLAEASISRGRGAA